MSNEQNAIPNRPSLLDRIHLFREFATRAGWSDVAEWLTKHADEPCLAATAEFMAVGTEAVREAIALGVAHAGCQPMTPCLADAGWRSETMCDQTLRNRPLLAALADAEQKLADATSEFFPSEFMLGGFRHKVTAVEGHYDGSYIVAQKIGEFDPPTKPLPPPSELAEAAERKLQVERARVADLTSRLAATEKWGVKGWTRSAVLTRKLAMAREAITVVLRIIGYPANGMPPLEGDDELHALHKFKTTMQAALAAIDAPAGEEAKLCMAMHHDFVSTAIDGTSDICGVVLLPGTKCGMGRNACIHAKCRNATASHPMNCTCQYCRRPSPPPEPANAQGSGDAEESLSAEPCIAIEDLPLEGQNNICGRPLINHCPFPGCTCPLQHHPWRVV